jgi:cytochrome c oxidase cbb3-type subunit 3
MSQEEDKIIENHSYDGIQEYDNPLPTWWLLTFFATIIFAFIYYIHYEFGGGPNLKQELEVVMQELNQQKAAHGLKAPQSEAEFNALVSTGNTKSGAKVFTEKCAACHGPELGGIIGPNLTDNYWISGKGTPADIYKAVSIGVLEKGMPAWGEVLTREEIGSVVAFIKSKKGSNPAGAKTPQGEKVE